MPLIEIGKASQVLALIEGLETKVGDDADMVSDVWSLRITALQAEGKLDQAQTLFEALRQSSPGSPSVATAAGVLARALDRSADAPPTSYSEPLWPATAAVVYRTLGIDTNAARYMLVAINSIFFGVTCGAIYLIGAMTFFRPAGLISVALVLLHKPILDQVPVMWSRMMGMALLSSLLVAAAWIRRGGATT